MQVKQTKNNITERFDRLTEWHGIDEAWMLELVKTFYEAGLAQGLQLPVQHKCKLVTKNSEPLHFPVEPNSKLSQAQVQQLSSILNKILNEFEQYKQDSKRIVGDLWGHCNPEDPDTYNVYNQMNLYKDNLREIKETYNKMASLQRILKKMAKNG